MIEKNIYDFVAQETIAYQTIPVTVSENYEWSMMQHINTTILYKNSKYTTGNREDKPFKNIIRPILNLEYRAEGFDLKDIILFVDDAEKYFMSFLVSKFHDIWARKNDIDNFISDMVESYIDFGGVLLKNVYKERPEVVKMQSIAFCDQTDIMGGPIGLKHFFSPSELLKMKKRNWGNKKYGATISVDDLITMGKQEKVERAPGLTKSKTPGNYLEIYEVHGDFPSDWLKPYDQQNQGQYPDNKETHEQDIEYTPQMHIITMLKKPNGEKQGETLFCGPEPDPIFKFLARDAIYGRALGMGGAEELFEPQVWTNYDVIRMKGMLDAACKIIYQTTDPAFANRNKTDAVDNGEILIVAEGSEIAQINTQPVNLPAFEKSMQDWQDHAQQMGAAQDPLMGETPNSGTPFAAQNAAIAQSSSLHDYRKGKLAVFLGGVYRDWILPYIAVEVSKDQQFMGTLTLDEMIAVSDSLVTIMTNDMMKKMVLNGQTIDPQMVQKYKQEVQQAFMKGGNKRFIKIMDGELKDAPIDVTVDVAGKQKDLAGVTDKLVNIFREIISNPTILDDPRASKIFNQILEYSGFSPIDFYSPNPPQPQGGQQKQTVSESIAFKDLPPDGQQQMAAQAGIKISSAAPPSRVPAMATK